MLAPLFRAALANFIRYIIEYMLVENISTIIAFTAGILSFLSPCVLPLVPVYFASISGAGVIDGAASRSFRLPLLLHSASFVLGFSVVFATLGAIAGITGYAVSLSTALLYKISGSLLIAMGIFMLLALKVPWLNYEKRLAPSASSTTGYVRSFVIGGTFSMAWTACVGPILAGILSLAFAEATAWKGAYLLAIYSVGLGLPFLIIGAAFDVFTPLLRRIQRYSRWIYIISSVLLLVVGILILTNRLSWFASLAG